MSNTTYASLLVASLFFGACSNRALSIDESAGRLRDFSTGAGSHLYDFSVGDAQGDGARMNDGCMNIATWANGQQAAHASFTPAAGPMDGSEIVAYDVASNAEGNYQLISVQVDVPQGMPPMYPQTITLTSTSTSEEYLAFGPGGSSDLAVSMYRNCDITEDCDNADAELYVAQGGTITLTRVDDTPSGSMSVVGSDLHFLQWGTDGRLLNGKCWDVGAFSASQPYTLTGGSDLGAPHG